MEPNYGITRRDMLKRGAIFGGAVMWSTPVVQTVGMSRALAATPSDNCSPQWAATVSSSNQGDRKDGSAVLGQRSDPSSALGAPDSGDGTFFSLGFGGTITVRFAERAYRDTGSEALVVETTNGNYPLERALVEVSPDGTNFESVGFADNVGGNTSNLSLAGISFNFIQYVRVTDVTDPAPFEDMADAFDVNAVGVGCP